MPVGRKVVFVLGAGASLGAGATASVQRGGSVKIPIQSSFWRVFLKFAKSPENHKVIESFLFRYFTEYDRVPSRLNAADRGRLLARIDVEEVFTFLSERSQSPSTPTRLKVYIDKVWKAMISEIGNVFGRFPANRDTKSVYRSLIKNQFGNRDAVVSFNYDIVFEDSLLSSTRWGYHCVTETTGRLSIYKPHGSINWVMNDDVILHKVSHKDQPVVVAPSHLKFSLRNNTSNQAGYLDAADTMFVIWRELEKELKLAKAIVFIGYSFPSADLYFTSLLRTVFSDRQAKPKIILVNPDAVAISDRVFQKFQIRTKNYFDLGQFSKISRKEALA